MKRTLNDASSEELRLLRRIEELLLVIVKSLMHDVLASNLKEPEDGMLYELTGKLSVTELSKKTGFSAGKISNIWQSWERTGMLVKDGKQYRRLF